MSTDYPEPYKSGIEAANNILIEGAELIVAISSELIAGENTYTVKHNGMTISIKWGGTESENP